MQTKDRGKLDILPVAGASLDHALLPVTSPRNSDADMRRDGSAIPPRIHIPPSMSAEECTAHQDSIADQRSAQAINNGHVSTQISMLRHIRTRRKTR